MAKAKYYLLTCTTLSGAEAERIGLVSLAVPDEGVQSMARRVAKQLVAEGSPTVIAHTQGCFNHSLRSSWPAFEQSLALEMIGFAGRDAREGLSALTEKRAPVRRTMKFADFRNGQVIEAGPYEVFISEVMAFAKAYDPQWFHTDPKAAAQGRLGGLIASGWHTCAIAMRLVAGAALEGSESFASPGLQSVKWPNPVRPGDLLRLQARVVETRTSRRQPWLGIVRWQWRLIHQSGLDVLDLEATSLFDLAAAAPDREGSGGLGSDGVESLPS